MEGQNISLTSNKIKFSLQILLCLYLMLHFKDPLLFQAMLDQVWECSHHPLPETMPPPLEK